MGSSPISAYTRSGSREEYVQALVMEHIPLAKSIASSLIVSLGPTVSRDDLYSAATLGLVEAAHRFDETKGAKFSTFAYLRVKGAIMDCLRRSDSLGKHAREQLEELREVRRAFRGRTGRTATIEELADLAGMGEAAVLKCLAYERWDRVSSLDEPYGQGEGSTVALSELIDAGVPTPLENLQEEEKLEHLAQAIERLPEREKQIIVMYYYEDLYMAEMADVFGVSESRISQLHTRAVYNLARLLEGNDE